MEKKMIIKNEGNMVNKMRRFNKTVISRYMIYFYLPKNKIVKVKM